MFIFKICEWIKSGNIFLAHPVYYNCIRITCNLVVAIFAFCLNVLKNICFDRFVFSRDRLMLSELRYDTLSIYEELIVTNL